MADSMNFIQEWKTLSDEDKDLLKTWAEEEMAALGIESSPVKYIKSILG